MRRSVRFLSIGAAAGSAAVAICALSHSTGGGVPSAIASSGVAATRGDATGVERDTIRGSLPALAQVGAGVEHDLDRTSTGRAASKPGAASDVESDELANGDRQARELARRCDARILAEAVDATWSRAKNEQFTAFFARQALTGTTVKAVDCRTTMCRIDLAHNSAEARVRFIQSFDNLAGPTGMVFAHIEIADDLDIEVYVTRDGTGLP